MDLFHAFLLIVAGIAGGALGALVGGASVVTFPALLAVGLSPVVAVASNLVALTPSVVASVFADRQKLPPIGRWFVLLVLTSVTGAAIGAGLLLVTPARTFEFIVPLLLGLSTVLLAFGSRISAWLREHLRVRYGRELQSETIGVLILLLVSIYGGYFGAGAGVMLLAIFLIWSADDYRVANVMKNVVGSLGSLVASLVFVFQGAVDWPAALVMMGGGIAGGALGIKIAQVAPRAFIQVLVIGMGVFITVFYAWRYWF